MCRLRSLIKPSGLTIEAGPIPVQLKARPARQSQTVRPEWDGALR
jgi:hypothetical protein